MATKNVYSNFKNYVYIPPPRPGPHHLLGSNNYKKVQVILSGDSRLGEWGGGAELIFMGCCTPNNGSIHTHDETNIKSDS